MTNGLWAGYKDDGLTVYKPIPRDRDQAFSLYDGLLPMIAGRAITQIEGYGKDYPKIYNLSFNGRYLDRRILPMVEKNVYDSLTNFIKGKTFRIRLSMKRSVSMPKEWYTAWSQENLKSLLLQDVIQVRSGIGRIL
jgi:hypothetical protein